MIERLDKNLYLIKILLIKLADDCFPEQKFQNWDVLKILQTAQKEFERLEKKTPELVKVKRAEQTKGTLLLVTLDGLKSLYPNVKLPEVVPAEQSPEKPEPNPSKEDDDDVEIVSVQKKGIEVICLDDD